MGEENGQGGNGESRYDRELAELLQELRVAIPGVQVLFAFLLTVPFAQGFTTVTDFQKHVYFVTLVLTALATALLISPTARHRLLFRQHDKAHLLKTSNRLSIVGLALLALAITGAMLLITDVLFGPPATVVAAAAIAAVFALLWYVMPLVRRLRSNGD